MKAFRFSLERVLQLRTAQMKSEEGKLETLLREEHRRKAQLSALDASLTAAHGSFAQKTSFHSHELLALESFSRRVDLECRQMTTKIAEVKSEIEGQRVRVVQKRSQVRLLERLKDRRRAEWQVEADRDLTLQAEDFSAAQWVRNKPK
jgi:flagellar export protein FliJ